MKRTFRMFGAAGLVAAAAMTAQAATPQQNAKFVTKLYQDLLNRTPTNNEQTLYAFALGFGATRAQVAGVVTSSNEYRTDRIQGYYTKFLNRAASASELAFYLNYLQNGATQDDLKAALLGSDEYFRLAGGTDVGFLNRLYADVLGRPLDRSAALTFETLLSKGTPRQTIAAVVVKSVEAHQRVVTALFAVLLHRTPSAAELNGYLQMLQLGAKEEMLIDLICGSDEYFNLAQN